MVYAFAVAAALIVATGEAVQQRLAAQAPTDKVMSWRLLIWLVRRPRWLVGVGFSLAGNIMFALAVSVGNVVRTEAVFVIRLVFALVIAASLRRTRVPRRDAVAGLLVFAGLVAFLTSADPRPSQGRIALVAWSISLSAFVLVVVAAWVGARRLQDGPRASLLGGAAGMAFGVQAALTQAAVRRIGHGGLSALLGSWQAYALCAVALLGMLLVQNAFEAAPLSASYPAVVTGQLLTSIALGVGLLGVEISWATSSLIEALPALAAMTLGVVVLSRSHLVSASAPPRSRGSNADHLAP